MADPVGDPSRFRPPQSDVATQQKCLACNECPALSATRTVPLCEKCSSLVKDSRGVSYEQTAPSGQAMNAESLEAQILRHLHETVTPTVSDNDVLKEIEGLFVSGNDFLRRLFPNPSIRRMASLVGEILANKLTPIQLGFPVRALGFLVIGDITTRQGFIAAPKNWNEMIRRDPITQIGAIVLVGSHMVDYANERFTEDPENVKVRASAYEAEFFTTVRSLSPDWELMEYHQKILSLYPEGLATPRVRKVLYSARPLVLA